MCIWIPKFQTAWSSNNKNLSLDIYVCCVSTSHHVCPDKYYIAVVSTTVETNNPEAELKPGLDVLAPIEDKYVFFLFFKTVSVRPGLPCQSFCAHNEVMH